MHGPSVQRHFSRVARWSALLFAIVLLLPAALYVHIELEESSPAADEVLSEIPSELRLLFSARIEGRYTNVTLTGPGGARVSTGDVVFVTGSDREVTLGVPSLTQPGTYTVRWRTAGADGHVLEGSYAFVLATDSGAPAAASRGLDRGGNGVPADSTIVPAGVSVDAAHAPHQEPESVGDVRDAIGRAFHFIALLLLLGGVTFRAVLMPRIGVAPATSLVLQRRAWQLVAAAALLLAVSAVLRLWFQSTALHGAERAWNTALLSILLTDTSWGRAWMLQAFLFVLLGMAIVWARPGRDRAGLWVAILAVLGLSTIPALSGHAAGAAGLGRLIVLNDAVHVAAAGAWLGTLAVLVVIGIPAIRQLESRGDAAAADAIDTFSPLALTAGAFVLLSGVINGVMHLTTPAQLWTTDYGRVLLVKLLFVAGVGIAGFLNWRLVRPVLRQSGGIRRLRLSATAELVFAFLVLTVTAVLTGQPRP